VRLVFLALLIAGCDGNVPGDGDMAVTFDLQPLDFANQDLTAPPPATPHLYIGGYAGVISHEVADGGVTTTPAGAAPSFLAVDPTRRRMYAVDETNSMVIAFSIDPASGALTQLNMVSSGGSGPAHVTVDATGNWVLVANYGDGKVAVLPVTPTGLGDATDIEIAGTNAHQVVVDPGDQYAWVPCKGSDWIALYDFDAAHGTLTPAATAHITVASGAGPRHLAFHPTRALAYLINENDSTLNAFTTNADGTLTNLQTISTLPSGFTGMNTGAEVQINPPAANVYASNRGHDSIARFSIGADGKLSLLDHTPTGGMTPRHFSLDPALQNLWVANQDSSSVTHFAVASSGALTASLPSLTVSMPSYAGVILLP
jgi:6-phosphogluconolactonase